MLEASPTLSVGLNVQTATPAGETTIPASPTTSFGYGLAKRTMDIMVSAAGLALLFPVFGILAIVIAVNSPGPVFFKQRRYGFRGRVIYMYKFRSMVVDAEALRDTLVHKNEASGPIFKMKNDPRVTKVGRFIRKTSMDELPQLLNVLLGEMSLIGPRPLPLKEVDLCDERQWTRHLVKPGLLCYREIGGRSRLTHEEWIESDLRYVSDRSFLTDCHIFYRAFGAVLRSEDAY
jgi:lipopolysaccharide/colanic/teichoic acid biosynthesis glycosyltransferase